MKDAARFAGVVTDGISTATGNLSQASLRELSQRLLVEREFSFVERRFLLVGPLHSSLLVEIETPTAIRESLRC
jgi:hypothetical protein